MANDISFNPRSREGSDRLQHFLDLLLLVSIHAPARGATVNAPKIITNK